VDDFALLERWAQGDRVAGGALFERYFDAIHRFFANRTSREVADLVQDTFTACIAARDRFRRESSFRTFLFATARNVLFAHYRGKGRDGDDEAIGDSMLIDLDPSPSSMLGRRDEERLLLEALRRIPLDSQLAIELYEWEELTAPEAAEVLGISEAALRSRVHRAKHDLREQLRKLAASHEVLESTISDLERWAAALRARVTPSD
jgi:RNA polymerase sigma-70 factor (ECF subfamily)